MKKTKILNMLLALVFIFLSSFTLTSCGDDDYSLEDVSQLNADMIADHEDVEGNLFFGNAAELMGNTIQVQYNPYIQNISLSNDDVTFRYYALTRVHNNLLRYIFRYYENWKESFFENAEEKCTQEEINTLYNKMKNLRSVLNKFKGQKDNFEKEIEIFTITTPLTISVTSYTYELNMLLEKAFDFVKYFRNIHSKKIFGEGGVNVYSTERLIDEMYLNIAEFVYYENIKPFNYTNGLNGVCDLFYLIREYYNGSTEYALLDRIQGDICSLRPDVEYALNQNTNEEIIEKVQQFMYYASLFNQNMEVYRTCYNDLDYYELSQYRFNIVVGTDIDSYISRYNVKQSVSYTFTTAMRKFVLQDYLSILQDLSNI